MSETWSLTQLGAVLQIKVDSVPVVPTQTYRISGVYSFGRGLFARKPLLGTDTTYKTLNRLHAGDFVLSQVKGWEGALCLIPPHFDGWFLSPQFPTFRPIDGVLDVQYLDWFFKQIWTWEKLRRMSRGMGARRETVSPANLLSIEIPLPSFDEQRRIVARLDALAARISEAQHLRQQAIEEAQVLVTSSARSLIGNLAIEPSELRAWVDPERDGIQTGPFGAQLGSSDFIETGHALITIGNVQYDGLHLAGLKYVSEEKAKQLARYTAQAGDILFARMGTVGRCCVVPDKANGWLFNYHIIRVAPDRTRVEPRYLHWIIRASPDVEGYLEGNIRGATREGVNTRIVGGLPCRIPSIDEQRRIVAHLDALQATVDELQCLQAESAAELDALLPSLLDRAFKGEL